MKNEIISEKFELILVLISKRVQTNEQYHGIRRTLNRFHSLVSELPCYRCFSELVQCRWWDEYFLFYFFALQSSQSNPCISSLHAGKCDYVCVYVVSCINQWILMMKQFPIILLLIRLPLLTFLFAFVPMPMPTLKAFRFSNIIPMSWI